MLPYSILLTALNLLLLLLLYNSLLPFSSSHSDFQGYHAIPTPLFGLALVINLDLTIVCIFPLSLSIR